MPTFVTLTILGHLAKDPELRTTQGGTELANCTIAWNTGPADKRKAHFLDLVAFGETAKRLKDWMAKGDAILVDGELQQESWTDKESGKARSRHSMIVRVFQNLSPKKAAKSTPPDDDAPPPDTLPYRRPASQAEQQLGDDLGSIPFGWLLALPMIGLF